MYEDRYLLVFACGGLVGSGSYSLYCEDSTYWYLDVEVWLDLAGYRFYCEDSTYWYLDVEVWLGLAGYRFYVWGQALTGIYMWRFG